LGVKVSRVIVPIQYLLLAFFFRFVDPFLFVADLDLDPFRAGTFEPFGAALATFGAADLDPFLAADLDPFALVLT